MINESILVLRQYDAVKIASDQISQNEAHIESDYSPEMCFDEGKRHAEEVEGIRHAVRKSAYDE